MNHDAALNTLFIKNPDLLARLKDEELTYSYDMEREIFWMHIGKQPKEVITESINNRIYLRYNPDSGKICGIEFFGTKILEEGS